MRLSHLLLALSAGLLGAATAPAATRVVSLGGSVTEIVYALGRGERLVARDSSSVFPAQAAALPEVGYFRTVSAEGILSMRPTLVLAATGSGPALELDRVRSAGVPVEALNSVPSAAAVIGSVTTVGALLEAEAEAAALAQRIQRDLEQVGAAIPAGDRPRVVFLMNLSGGAASAAGSGTAAQAMIELIGGENPLAEQRGFRQVAAEAIVALDPDAILTGSIDQNPDLPAWLAGTRAGRAGRVRSIDLGYHLVFGPRVGAAALELATWLHQQPQPAAQ